MDIPLPSHGNFKCFVGSGECDRPAAFAIDDGTGGVEYICAPHKEEFDAFEKLIEQRAKDDPEFMAEFGKLITQAEQNELNGPPKSCIL